MTETKNIGLVSVGSEIQIPIENVCNNGAVPIPEVVVELKDLPDAVIFNRAQLPRGTWDTSLNRWLVGTVQPGECLSGLLYLGIIDDTSATHKFTFVVSTEGDCVGGCEGGDSWCVITEGITCTQIRSCDPPMAGADVIVIPKNTVDYAGDLSGNDSECPYSLTRTYLWTDDTGLRGTLTGPPDSFTYSPEPGYCGIERAKYGLYCNDILVDEAELTINVTCGSCVHDEVYTNVDTEVSDSVAGGDTPCLFGGVTRYELVSDPAAEGDVSEATTISDVTVTSWDRATGDFTATPENGFTGIARFDYVVSCYDIGEIVKYSSSPCTVEVIVPYADAIDDTGAACTGNVGDNDITCTIGGTTYKLQEGSEANGTVVFTAYGDYEFTPDNLATPWSFGYDLMCYGVVIDSAVVNGGPVTADANDIFDAPVQGDVSTNDTECSLGTTEYAAVPGSETNATVVLNPDGTYSVTVTDVSDPWSFDYEITCTACGGSSVIDSATVIGGPVTAVATTDDMATCTGDVSTNDTECSDGVTRYYVVTGSEVNGTAALNTNGTYSFASDDITKPFTFDYEIRCEYGGVEQVVDTASVLGGPITADANDVDEGTQALGTVSGNVADNDDLCSDDAVTTFGVVGGSEANGTVTNFDPATGDFDFDPDAAGSWSFDYEITCDACGNSAVIDTATVSGEAT